MWISQAELARLMGEETAERVCDALGGVTSYIPLKPSLSHPLGSRLGFSAMELLCLEYGGEKITLPARGREAKKPEILKRLARGEKARDIALELNVTIRWVRTLAAAGGMTGCRIGSRQEP